MPIIPDIPRSFSILKTAFIALLSLMTAALILPSNSPANDLPVSAWNIIHDKSRLGFMGKYAAIEFDGRFNKYSAKILFDPKQPESGSFDVTIDTTSITTFNSERDSVIGDSDWFYFSKYPTSTYKTKSIKAVSGDQFVAIGTLDLKGRQKDVELRFTWNEHPNGEVEVEGQARMVAEADINRVDFGIGSGTWEKDNTVAFEVLVKINLLLSKE